MNTANLQLDGVLMAMAALCHLLREKGIAAEDEIDSSLRHAEQMQAADRLRPEQLSQSNVEAMLFPLRFLREANRCDISGAPLPIPRLQRLSVGPVGGCNLSRSCQVQV